jgi:hypothetical protein
VWNVCHMHDLKYSYCFIEIFWALMGHKKFGCGKVSLLYTCYLSSFSGLKDVHFSFSNHIKNGASTDK